MRFSQAHCHCTLSLVDSLKKPSICVVGQFLFDFCCFCSNWWVGFGLVRVCLGGLKWRFIFMRNQIDERYPSKGVFLMLFGVVHLV